MFQCNLLIKIGSNFDLQLDPDYGKIEIVLTGITIFDQTLRGMFG